jgi:hypothetical protein
MGGLPAPQDWLNVAWVRQPVEVFASRHGKLGGLLRYGSEIRRCEEFAAAYNSR